MINCRDCPHWNEKLEACEQSHTEMSEPVCLMRTMVWIMADIHNTLEDDDGVLPGDEWKEGV